MKFSHSQFRKIKNYSVFRGNPEFSHLVRWPNSIPLPDQSTSMRLDAAKVLTERNAGLVFSGSHILGAPLPNCIT